MVTWGEIQHNTSQCGCQYPPQTNIGTKLYGTMDSLAGSTSHNTLDTKKVIILVTQSSIANTNLAVLKI